MSDLDEKLRTILEDWYPGTMYQDVIPKLKQAFEDEGYVYIPQVEVVTRYEAGKKPEVFMVNGKEVMTGQEWYDRFIKLAPHQLTTADELDFNLHDNDPIGNCYYAYNCAIDEVKGAAKKASGIKEEQQNA